MANKHFNNFWQTLKHAITRKRAWIWKAIKLALLLGRVICWILRLFEGESIE